MMNRLCARLALVAGLGFSVAAVTPAQATITMEEDSNFALWAYAGTRAGADQQWLSQPLPDYYSNTLTAYSSYTYLIPVPCDGGDCYGVANDFSTAQASLNAYADSSAGVFQAWGGSVTNAAPLHSDYAWAEGSVQINQVFSIDTPYAYTLSLELSSGTYTRWFLGETVLFDYAPGTPSGASLQFAGVLPVGTYAIQGYVSGCSTCASMSSFFDYTLVLTPVPEVQTYALMLAGLGLIAWRARRR